MKSARLALIVGFYLAACLFFLGIQLVDENSRFDLLGALILPIFASTACLVDSFVIHKPLSLSTRWMTAVYWPVTTPYYLIWSRGWWGVGLAAIHSTVLCGAAVGASIAGIAIREVLFQ